ncbi:MAG: pilus assembly protein N-terminal domain-containing protein [Planctomycetaceae bacterium]|nr:pilus assembly protein N-terminal domain-containing protein [Planctomycetaceae bacterium]
MTGQTWAQNPAQYPPVGRPSVIPSAAGANRGTYPQPTNVQNVGNLPIQPVANYPVQQVQGTYPPGLNGPMMAPPGVYPQNMPQQGYPQPLPNFQPAMVGQMPTPMPMPGGQPYTTPATTPAQPALPVESIPVQNNASAAVQAKVDHYIADVIDPEVRLNVEITKGTLIRTKHPIERMSITNPGIVDTIQYHPNEFELVGRTLGETTLTLWFPDSSVPAGKKPYIRYLIRVVPDTRGDVDVPDVEYGKLQRRVNELFPNSHVQLIPVLDKLIVRGQARDAREAAQIMAFLGDQTINQFGSSMGFGGWGGIGGWGRGSAAAGGGLVGGGYGYGAGAGYGNNWNNANARAAFNGSFNGANGWGAGLGASEVINMLEIPGEQQVMLKVRVAELTRTALRQMGANFTGRAGDFTFSSVLNVQGAASAVLTTQQVDFAISALASNRTNKVLAEPNLVTLSGYTANFIAGGQFAVPTVVGVGGAAAATTGFQGYGTQVSFTPTVLDKDHIRLMVAPTVSRLDAQSSVNGIFGLNVRSVATTVDLREGQWLAIAGLIQDQQTGEKARVPWLGDIPILDMVFSRKSVSREETEIVILVSPELVHPMEPDQVPQILPGMEVTEPDDAGFYFRGRWEGNPDHQHRSTVWPVYRNDVYDARNRAIRDAKGGRGYLGTERYFMKGAHGFCN